MDTVGPPRRFTRTVVTCIPVPLAVTDSNGCQPVPESSSPPGPTRTTRVNQPRCERLNCSSTPAHGDVGAQLAHTSDVAQAVNQQVAGRLEEAARLLRDQGADPYRVNAYRRAAATLRTTPVAVDVLFREKGLDGLMELRGVGETITRAIRELLLHGRLPMLDRLRGESDPVALLGSVPGIGRRLAGRLHDELGLETLADLETAAHDGRLETIVGSGEKRLAGIRDSLAHRLGRVRLGHPIAQAWPPGPATGPAAWPPVSELLDVDREYREKAAAGQLRLIAPRRFNPTARRGCRSFTRSAAAASTRRSIRTPRGPIELGRHETGSCSISTMGAESGSTR